MVKRNVTDKTYNWANKKRYKQVCYYFILRTKPFKILAHKFFREPQKYFLRALPLKILARKTDNKPKANVIATPHPITSRLRYKL